ncbi:MAG: polysaccharide deacetylase family protein [bacterium]
MKKPERSLVEKDKHARGKYGGFCFGGQHPDGVSVHNALRSGVEFPNGARAALLLTFDVEGTYGNGIGDMKKEIANYKLICEKLTNENIPATFNIVAQMAEEQGPDFIKWMEQADCEIAAHGYVHELNKVFGGDKVYAGHYGLKENLYQVGKGVEVLNKICRNPVQGIRLPYAHFNEFTYDAIAETGLKWTSNVGNDDFLFPGQGFGGHPFQIMLGDKLYPLVEIPLDSQTYDWAVWIADEKANSAFVKALRNYCNGQNLPYKRTPEGAIAVWKRRMEQAIEKQSVFTLLCHPINLTVKSSKWGDPLIEFLFPVIELLAEYRNEKSAWVCTSGQMADFCRRRWK